MGQEFRTDMKIRHRPEFLRVFKEGRKFHSRLFTLFVMPGNDGPARLGVVASRKTGGAVARNRAKRLLRETFRQAYPLLSAGTDFVVVAKRSIVKAKLADVEKEFRDAIGLKND